MKTTTSEASPQDVIIPWRLKQTRKITGPLNRNRTCPMQFRLQVRVFYDETIGDLLELRYGFLISAPHLPR